MQHLPSRLWRKRSQLCKSDKFVLHVASNATPVRCSQNRCWQLSQLVHLQGKAQVCKHTHAAQAQGHCENGGEVLASAARLLASLGVVQSKALLGGLALGAAVVRVDLCKGGLVRIDVAAVYADVRGAVLLGGGQLASEASRRGNLRQALDVVVVVLSDNLYKEAVRSVIAAV